MRSSTAMHDQIQPMIALELNVALEEVKEGRLPQALTSVKRIRASHPQNIFVVALQKQVEKMEDLQQAGTLTPDERSHLFQSLPAIVERAIEEHNRNIGHVESRPDEQKTAALEKLRNQYLQRADECIEKEEFDRAQEEVKRVYIVSPGDENARIYERRIAKLRDAKLTSASTPAVVDEPEHAKDTTTETLAATRNEQKQKKNRIVTVIVLVVIAVAGTFIGTALFLKKQSRTVYNVVQMPYDEVYQEVTVQPKGASDQPVSVAQAEKPSENVKNIAGKNNAPELPAAQDELVSNAPAIEKMNPPKENVIQKLSAQPIESRATTTPKTIGSRQERLPSILRLQSVEFPASAAKKGQEGKVMVRVQISEKGKPLQAKILSSTNPIFDDAVVIAVMKSEYTPGMMPSGPVTSWVTIPFNFKKSY